MAGTARRDPHPREMGVPQASDPVAPLAGARPAIPRERPLVISEPEAGEAMDSYVIHIFRRPGTESDALVGLVERIGQGDRRAFHDQDQLLEYLLRESGDSAGDLCDTEKKK